MSAQQKLTYMTRPEVASIGEFGAEIMFGLFRVDHKDYSPLLGSDAKISIKARHVNEQGKPTIAKMLVPATIDNICEHLGVFYLAKKCREHVEDAGSKIPDMLWKEMIHGLKEMQFLPAINKVRDFLITQEKFPFYFYATNPLEINPVVGENILCFKHGIQVMTMLPRTFDAYESVMKQKPSPTETRKIAYQTVSLALKMAGHRYGYKLQEKEKFLQIVSGWLPHLTTDTELLELVKKHIPTLLLTN